MITESPTIDQVFDGFTSILMSGFTPDYMEITLKHLRELVATPNTREDVTEFLAKTAGIPENAIVVLTSKSVRLLTDDGGNLLEFA